MGNPEKQKETARQYADFEQSARDVNEIGKTYDSLKCLAAPIDQYLDRFDVKAKSVVGIMHLKPILALGLGMYDENGIILDGTGVWNAPRDITIQNKGLIRHTVGVAVRAQLLTELLNDATDAELVPFKKRGFHTKFFKDLPALAIRDAILVSHYGDIIAKQTAKQIGRDIGDAWLDRAVQMNTYLARENAHPILRHLLASELCHVAFLKGERPTMKERYAYPHIVATQVPDWWYDVKPIETETRLRLISQAQRAAKAIRYLPILWDAARKFNAALRDAFGPEIIHAIQYADDPLWAQEILDAYAAQVGMTHKQLFGAA